MNGFYQRWGISDALSDGVCNLWLLDETAFPGFALEERRWGIVA